jgi:hypothetical protein
VLKKQIDIKYNNTVFGENPKENFLSDRQTILLTKKKQINMFAAGSKTLLPMVSCD